MNCTHQWADATTKAGPEWVCAHCKVKYSDTKKDPPAKRGWVGLTDEEIDGMVQVTDLSGAYYYDDLHAVARAAEAKLKELNDL